MDNKLDDAKRNDDHWADVVARQIAELMAERDAARDENASLRAENKRLRGIANSAAGLADALMAFRMAISMHKKLYGRRKADISGWWDLDAEAAITAYRKAKDGGE